MIRCSDCRADLSAYASGELSGSSHDAMRGHLAGCAECRVEATALSRLETRVRESLRASFEPLPPGFAEALRARILEAPSARRSWTVRVFGALRPSPARLVAAGSIAAVAVALVWGERFVPAPTIRPTLAAARPTPANDAWLELASDPDALFAAWGAGLIEASDVATAARATWGEPLETDFEMARRVATGELTDEEARAVSAVFGGDEGI